MTSLKSIATLSFIANKFASRFIVEIGNDFRKPKTNPILLRVAEKVGVFGYLHVDSDKIYLMHTGIDYETSVVIVIAVVVASMSILAVKCVPLPID